MIIHTQRPPISPVGVPAGRKGEAGARQQSAFARQDSLPTNSTDAIPSVFAAFHRVTITQSGMCYVVNKWLHISRRSKHVEVISLGISEISDGLDP